MRTFGTRTPEASHALTRALRKAANKSHARLDVAIAADAPQPLAPGDADAARKDRRAADGLAAVAFNRQPGQRAAMRVIAVEPIVARRHVAGIDVRH